ncbi:hypothetical protein CY0110_18857 [Crocosphaera chwakensis CCY0110]|uniref:Uncharacterized protein n=1 Tax=Crocosphaera chwakensis CCY0110 TaxID=391612 RepID=A3IJA3_9CHRO|nr:hypothetical protein CY0110_18857 [Crocosphaera chwakensis CCY0110]
MKKEFGCSKGKTPPILVIPSNEAVNLCNCPLKP